MRKRMMLSVCAVFGCLMVGVPVLAQMAEGATGESAVAAATVTVAEPVPALMPVPQIGMSMVEAWTYGGWIMWVLAAGSVLGLALVLYLFWTLRTSQVASPQLLGELLTQVRADDLAAARRVCEARPSPLALVALAAFDHLRNAPGSDPMLLRADMEAEGVRQAENIQGGTQWLLDISVIAPMLGLLGTVMGMLKAFGSVATDVASAKPVVLAAGVSQAIVTTIFGLAVAIPAMIAYSYFRRRASRQLAMLEAASVSLATALINRFNK